MNASAKISPDHFAAPGKRVQSTTDPSDHGTVVAWLGEGTSQPYGMVVVQWDSMNYASVCAFHEIDPLEEEEPTPKPETILAWIDEVVEVGGFRGVVRAVHWKKPGASSVEGVFVLRSDAPSMLYVKTGARVEEDLPPVYARRFEVVEVRETTRDEFDEAMGLDDMRRQFGWRF